ncbi:MAG: energy transducer TonB [Pontixanthobacter sp.]
MEPTPIGSPGLWASSKDYPPSALREDREGISRFSLVVDASGSATECAITESSGSVDLDETTCKLLLQRAKFEPARGVDGAPVESTWDNAVRWQIPNRQPGPGSYESTITVIYEKDGSVSFCKLSQTNLSASEEQDYCLYVLDSRIEPYTNDFGEPVRKQVVQKSITTVEDVPPE